MRVLVTGATGFIGRSFLSQLSSSSRAEIYALTRQRSETETSSLASLNDAFPNLTWLMADLLDMPLTAQAVQEVRPDYVVHLAAAGVTDPFLKVESALRHNVAATINLLRACFERDASVRQLIVARTPGELSAMNIYAASKAAAWAFCRMYARTAQWPINGAMIFQAYGPGQPAHTLVKSAMTAAIAGTDFPMSTGNQRKDWIYVDDATTALAKMIGSFLPPGESLEIGTGSEISVVEVVELIYQLVNRGGRPLIGALPDRPGEAQSQCADAARTRALIGWQPAITLEEGLMRTMRELNNSLN